MEHVLEPAPSVNSTNPPPIPPPVNTVAPFLSKTYDMVDDPSTNEVVSWSSGNNSFVVWDVPEFSKVFLPKYFKHNNFSSFVRQLNTYGFRKVDPDRWEFANEGFLRDQKQLLKGITRRKSSHVQQQQNHQVQNSSLTACVEVGKFGIAEEEVERLKRDKNVLTQEIVRLRHQQQATEHQLQDAVQKVQAMEHRQQQMMSFLAKAVRSPGFLNQLVVVQQSNDGGRQIQGSSNKKRRLPEEADRQIVKYQPSINEAAQTMLRQFLNMSSSNESESVSDNPGSFLLGDVPSANSLNSSNTVSGETQAEVSPDSAHSAMNQVPEAGLAHHPQAGLVQPTDQGVVAAASWSPESELLVGCETGNGECLDPIVAALGDAVTPEGEGEMKALLNEVPELPGVQDPFWEQFFADEAPVSGETDETVTGSVENSDLAMEQELSEWTRDQQQVNHITEQMGFLSSETHHGGEVVKGI
ncbi:Heat stress transcription factor A-1b [Raphanus sativus]|uniref:Heat stress transcription factor A-1b isoform X2 n=1 Tax=Raphanus sativus TaxID=3726 RepID=A0A6J0K4W2_RAPSA|nr:heat stress transcription factor A-1b isoform X2 [Raphanus sativus]KAJ4882654.1 Heat stress transcription factor A-1b [Raphanus sativus]